DWPEYREYLRRLLLDRPFQGASEGVCHGCGVRAPVTPETAPFRYKFYITDKKNFAPGLADEAFPKALALCRECFASLLLGERFAKARLEIPFLGVRALVLPEGEGRQDPKALANRVERLLAQVQGLEKVKAWKEFLQHVGPDSGSGFLGFSLVLFERKQSSTKVQEAVYEVPPSRVEALFQAMRESQWLRPWGGEVQGLGEWRELLEEGGNALALRVAVHLLGGVPLERGFLLPHLLATAKVALWRGQKGPGVALRLLALGAGWIWVLRRLGMLREEGTERAWAGDLDREYRKRFEEYGFGPLRAGLYLLGVALERVGHAQAQAA
ncbi:MAG: TM1802 family CRISPR-associated protein, partial [Thermus sp.]